MVDKTGIEYVEAVNTQLEQVLQWQSKLRAEIYHDFSTYVFIHNRPAVTANDKHQVFRGQDLLQILLAWPNPGPCYPQRGEDLI